MAEADWDDWVTDEARLLNEILATLRDILAALKPPVTAEPDLVGQYDDPRL